MDCERGWFDGAKGGDEAAFEKLIAPYRTRVVTYCKRLLHNAPEYEDAAQEALILAWQHLDSFQFEKPFVNWLMVIARNACFNILREKRTKIHPVTIPIDALDERSAAASGLPAHTVEDVVVTAVYLSDLLQKVKQRVDNERPRWDLLDWQIFHLHYEQNVTKVREVARQVGRNEDTVKYRLYNHIHPVLQKVCRELGEEERMEGE